VLIVSPLGSGRPIADSETTTSTSGQMAESTGQHLITLGDLYPMAKMLGVFPDEPDVQMNLYLLQIRVRCWVSENAQHRDNLTFVMKRVGFDVQYNKSRTPKLTTL
jgi:hypothetical protein